MSTTTATESGEAVFTRGDSRATCYYPEGGICVEARLDGPGWIIAGDERDESWEDFWTHPDTIEVQRLAHIFRDAAVADGVIR